jgi:hypothetical protein
LSDITSEFFKLLIGNHSVVLGLEMLYLEFQGEIHMVRTCRPPPSYKDFLHEIENENLGFCPKLSPKCLFHNFSRVNKCNWTKERMGKFEKIA